MLALFLKTCIMVAIGSNSKTGGGRRERPICYQSDNKHRSTLKYCQNGNINTLITSECRTGTRFRYTSRTFQDWSGAHGESHTQTKTQSIHHTCDTSCVVPEIYCILHNIPQDMWNFDGFSAYYTDSIWLSYY